MFPGRLAAPRFVQYGQNNDGLASEDRGHYGPAVNIIEVSGCENRGKHHGIHREG